MTYNRKQQNQQLFHLTELYKQRMSVATRNATVIDSDRIFLREKVTRCNAKPVGSPAAYLPRRLLVIADWSASWFACVRRVGLFVCLRPA